jgi:hypothetical protein
MVRLLSYSSEIWTVDYRSKKKLLRREMDFWRIAIKKSKILRIRNEAIRVKMAVTETILERMEK